MTLNKQIKFPAKLILAILIFSLILLYACIGQEPKPADKIPVEQPVIEKPIAEKPQAKVPETTPKKPTKKAVSQPVDPCSGITCADNEKCLAGNCYLKNCEEQGNYLCDGQKSACASLMVVSTSYGQCCTEQCISTDFEPSIGKFGKDKYSYLRFVDNSGYYHEIPLYMILETTTKDKELLEFVFDNYVTYYYAANTNDGIVRVKDGDLLNNNNVRIDYTARREIKINFGPALLTSNNVKINGITFNIDHVSTADWVDLLYRSSLKICEDTNCNKLPEPFADILNNTLYLNDGEIFTPKNNWHIMLRGKNNIAARYLPIIVERHNLSYLILVLDNQGASTFNTFNKSKIKFLGTNMDNDALIAADEPKYFAYDNRLFGNFGYSEDDNKKIYALFEITDENGKTSKVSLDASK